MGPGGVYDGSGGGGGLGPGGVYDGSGGQPIYINEDRIDAISIQSNIFQKNVFQLFDNFFFNLFHFFQFFQRFTVLVANSRLHRGAFCQLLLWQ